ncbi:ABC transporter permease [Microbacterium gallinarum]|uniref:Iron ABC transporter permease n=1 Tax=Microbacterium gallinarum TaxID=2762209 RepID=A0ABR8X0B1_9MICO|nr:iron ABC transporter permease [Microbacterium gallinarum]MBD8022748.1 iron ABC transporter permease [Microbacterium gallinarum]
MTITLPPTPTGSEDELSTRTVVTRRAVRSPKPAGRRHGRIALKHLRREIPSGILAIVLFFLIILPVVFIVIAAFSTSVPRPGNTDLGQFTLENFAILTTPQGIQSLVNSLVIGVGAGILSLVLGALLAFIAARTDAPWRRFIYIAGIAPMFLPALVGALAWSILASPSSGHLNLFLRSIGLPGELNIYSYAGLIFVLGIYYAPYTFMLTYSSFSMMNADLEEAAAIHGASLRKMFRTVTLPLAVPALAGAAILSFVLALENFPVNAILGNPAGIETLPTYIYRLMAGDPQPNAAAGIAVALTLAVVVVTWFQQRVVNRKRFTTLTGKGNRPRPVPLRWMRWVATGFAIAYFAVSVALPMLALIFTSMSENVYISQFADLFAGFSMDRILQAIGQSDFQQSTANSIVLAIGAAIFGTLIAFMGSYIRFRSTSKLGQLLEQVAMSPLAIPQVVLGMGILWAWLSLPFSIYGTLLLLIIATVAVNMPQGYRSVSSSMLQMDGDLENSAVMLGAGRLRAVRNITIPLMRTGIVSTLLLLLMLGLREMSAILFLYTSDTRVLSILVFHSFENGSISYSAAISLVFVLIIAIIAVATQLIGMRERRFKDIPA